MNLETSSFSNKFFKGRPLSLLAVLLLGAAGVRFYHLDFRGFWTDEFKTLRSIQLPLRAMIAERLSHGQMPLYFILLKGWAGVFGRSEAAIRSFSIPCGILLIVYLFLIARRTLGLECAWWSAGFCAIQQGALWAAQEARPYAFLMLAAAASFHALLLALETGLRKWWLIFFIWVLVGVLLHVSFPFLLIGQIIVTGVWFARRRHWRADWMIVSLCALAASGLLLSVAHHYNNDKFIQPGNHKFAGKPIIDMLTLFWGESWGQSKSIVRYPLALATAALLALALRFARAHLLRAPLQSSSKSAPPLPVFSFTLAWILSAWLGIALISIFVGETLSQARYYAIGTGGVCLMLGMAVCRISSPRHKSLLAAACFGVLAFASWSFSRSPGEQVREAVRYAAAHRKPQEPVVLYSGEAPTIADYYGLGKNNVYYLLGDARHPDNTIQAALQAAADAGKSFWLIDYYKGRARLDPALVQLIETRFRLDHEKYFHHARVDYYVPVTGAARSNSTSRTLNRRAQRQHHLE